jgi:hypothetical protein
MGPQARLHHPYLRSGYGVLVRARPLQVVQPAGHGVRVVEGLGRRPRAASAAALVRARLAQVVQQVGHGVRVVEGGVGGGPGRPARSSASPEEASANGTPG